jgi:hypothetical protein
MEGVTAVSKEYGVVVNLQIQVAKSRKCKIIMANLDGPFEHFLV